MVIQSHSVPFCLIQPMDVCCYQGQEQLAQLPLTIVMKDFNWLDLAQGFVKTMRNGTELLPLVQVQCTKIVCLVYSYVLEYINYRELHYTYTSIALYVYYPCIATSCGQLFDPVNGLVEFSSTTAGSIATYTCNPGFRLVGNDRRTCQNNRVWSGQEPRCQSS